MGSAIRNACLFACTFMATAGQAAEPEPPARCDPEGQSGVCEEPPAETLVITASRSEQRRFEACRSIEVLADEQVRSTQPRSLPEAIGEAAGVYLQQTNRGAGAPFIRGLVGPQNLILLDGVRFNTATMRTGPNQYLSLIDPYSLSRVEVVRGPSSVLYGSGAMGGVMHAIPSSPGQGPVAEAVGRFSSADLGTGATIRSRAELGDLAWFAGVSYNHFGTLRAGGGATQPDSDYTSAYWQAKLAWYLVPGWTLSAALYGAKIEDAGRMDRAGNGDLRFYDNLDHLGFVRLSWDGDGWLRTVRITLSYRNMDEDVDRYSCARTDDGTVAALDACFDRAVETLTRRRRYADTVDVIGADASGTAAFWGERLRLAAGLEAYEETVGSRLRTATPDSAWLFVPQARGNYSDGSTYRTMAAYAHLDAQVLDLGIELGELHLTGGARASHFAAQASDVPGLGDLDYAHTGLVGAAGLQWLTPGLANVYLTFVQGFRAPNLQETTNLGDTGQKFSVPNADLGPERSDTIEVGGRLQWGPVSGSLAYFHSWLSDAIVWEAATWNGQTEVEGKPVTRMVNATDGIHQGVEAAGSATWWRLTLDGNLTWTRGEETPAEGPTHPARWIPPLFGQVGLRYDHPDRIFWVKAQVMAARRQDRLHPQAMTDSRICQTTPYSGLIADPCDGTPGWATVNLRAGWKPTRRLEVGLALDNLTDQRYRTHGSGFDMPGFDLRLLLTAAL